MSTTIRSEQVRYPTEDDGRKVMSTQWPCLPCNFAASDWMGGSAQGALGLGSFIGDKRLLDLRLPATHDAGSYSCDHLVAPNNSAICQYGDTLEQLNKGVRCLDLRAGDYTNYSGIRVAHGLIPGTSFENVLNDIQAFVNAHPSEFVILGLDTIGNHALKGVQKETLCKWFLQYFGTKLITSADTWFKLGSVTLNDLWAHGKQIFVVAQGYDPDNPKASLFNWSSYDSGGRKDITPAQAASMGLFEKTGILFGWYADTEDRDKMYQHASEQLEQAQAGKENYNKLLSTSLTLTPTNATAGFVYRVRQLTRKVQEPLSVNGGQTSPNKQWFDNNKGRERINLVFADFMLGRGNTGDHDEPVLAAIQTNFVRDIIMSNLALPGYRPSDTSGHDWPILLATTNLMLVARNSGRVLDVKGYSNSDGATIWQWDMGGKSNQRWTIQPRPSDHYCVILRTQFIVNSQTYSYPVVAPRSGPNARGTGLVGGGSTRPTPGSGLPEVLQQTLQPPSDKPLDPAISTSQLWKLENADPTQMTPQDAPFGAATGFPWLRLSLKYQALPPYVTVLDVEGGPDAKNNGRLLQLGGWADNPPKSYNQQFAVQTYPLDSF